MRAARPITPSRRQPNQTLSRREKKMRRDGLEMLRKRWGQGGSEGHRRGKIRAITWVKGQGLEGPSRTAWRAAGADGGRVAGADGGRRVRWPTRRPARRVTGAEGGRGGGWRRSLPAQRETGGLARSHELPTPGQTRTQPALGKDPTRSDSIAPRTHSHPYQ